MQQKNQMTSGNNSNNMWPKSEFYSNNFDRIYKEKDYAEDAKLLMSGLTGSTILDVGGGTGTHAQYFRGWGFHVDLLEPDKILAAQAVDRVNGEIFTVPFQNFVAKKQYDNTVALWQVINFVAPKDIDAFFNKAREVTKEGGIFMFEVLDATMREDRLSWHEDGLFTRIAWSEVNGDIRKLLFVYPFRLKILEIEMYLWRKQKLEELIKVNNFELINSVDKGINTIYVCKRKKR